MAAVGLSRHVGGQATTETLAHRCQLAAGTAVLEVGCGTGLTAAWLAAELGCDVTAVDRHPRMLGWARRTLADRGLADRVAVVEADLRDLPFPDDTFDAVVGECVLAFVDDRPAALRELARVVRPGGVLGVNEPGLVGDGPLPDEVATFVADALPGMDLAPVEDWPALLSAAGLVDVTTVHHDLSLRDELRALVRRVGARELARVVAATGRTWRDDPELRSLIARRARPPRGTVERFGAGIHVGRVP